MLLPRSLHPGVLRDGMLTSPPAPLLPLLGDFPVVDVAEEALEQEGHLAGAHELHGL